MTSLLPMIDHMKKHRAEAEVAYTTENSSLDELRRHFQISLDEVRAGKGISAEESLRQLESDEGNALTD